TEHKKHPRESSRGADTSAIVDEGSSKQVVVATKTLNVTKMIRLKTKSTVATLNIAPNQPESNNSSPEGGLRCNTIGKSKPTIQRPSHPHVPQRTSIIQ
ncbi:hypothetical protein RYX36_025020, partial [Vicia faba]